MSRIETLLTKKLTNVFKALANQRRLTIIKLLANNSISVSDLSRELKVTIKSASKHLGKLERENLIHKEQKGKFVMYQISNTFKKSGLMNQIKKSK